MLRVLCRTRSVGAGVDAGGLLLESAELEPSVIVTEPSVLAPDVAGAIARASARHRVLIIDAPGWTSRGCSAGRVGVHRADDRPMTLRRAVEAADAGDLVLPGPAAAPPASRPPDAPRLTRRESDVLRALAVGGSTQDCARDLHLSVTTVKTHLRSANVKLGTTSRTSATAKAIALGLLG